MSSDEYANPGDTIISRNTSAHKGELLLVTEKPKEMTQAGDDTPGCAWFRAFSGQAWFLRADKYTVVFRAGKIYHKVVELDVDASLKKRRDDNLRHAFSF